MRIAVFETFNDDGATEKLNALLSQDGKTIVVDKIYTAAAATESYARHFVTVVYSTLEQAPSV